MGGTEPEEEEEEEHCCPNVFIPMHHDKEKTKELAIAKKIAVQGPKKCFAKHS